MDAASPRAPSCPASDSASTRMPVGMGGLAMLMMLRDALGSYALAGSVCGVCSVTMAVIAPIQGRLIDSRGARGLFFVTWTVHPAALLAILLLSRGGGWQASVCGRARHSWPGPSSRRSRC